MRLTIGCRARILDKSEGFSIYQGHEVLLVERSAGDFSAMVLAKGTNIPLEKEKEGVVLNEVGWIKEEDLELVDKDFDTNLDFIDWYQQMEEYFCPDCGKWAGEEANTCPKCGCDI